MRLLVRGDQSSDGSHVYVGKLKFFNLGAWLGSPGAWGTGLLGSLDPVSSEMLVYGSGSSGSSQMLIHGDASTRGGSVYCVASYSSYSPPQASFAQNRSLTSRGPVERC